MQARRIISPGRTRVHVTKQIGGSAGIGHEEYRVLGCDGV